ncbi:DinB family protein [Aquimarina sp. U1-2]|uniref:DinB family protein n=1 Tax=Aquimarina sp. U1-2 TaxID=2823141 RepID=UPI001AECB451|nr:DinB family protein [Aquimarina sp. U1-2]MBP2834117.1 DinB family protein [Aquimarina sp. U1-2]
MLQPLEITRTNRRLMQKILDNHSIAQLNKVPEGFKNNIIWNIAHVVVTQQLLVYQLSGLPMMIDDEMVNSFRKGTRAEGFVSQEQVAIIKALLFSTLDQTEKDWEARIFKNFKEYPTSTGYVLKSLDDAINFNNYHEGIHFGYVLALKKAL